ncbi:MAG: YwmB family TATA-box binding protein [Clostridia bacterium]|nr:YwmB family TATA-box binding protein [Clostridia bacterium]
MFKLLFKFSVALLFCLCFCLDFGGNLKGEGSHTFYFYNKSSNAKIITLTEEKANYFIYFKNSLKGESVVFYDQKRVNELLNELSAKKVFCESGDDFNCEYYYAEKIDDYIILKGNKINLHVCFTKNGVLVGTPIVFGSF